MLYFGFICCGWVDFQGIPTLLSVPVPENIHDDNLFFGGYSSPGGFRRFVVYRNYLEIYEYYEKELSQNGWTVKKNATTTRTGIQLCLKIEKPPILSAYIVIYEDNTDHHRTVVFIDTPMRGSTCENKF